GIGVRIVEVRVVERVKALGPELGLETFPDGEDLQEGEVPLILIGTAHSVEAKRKGTDVGGKLAGGVRVESDRGGGCEPVVDALLIGSQRNILQVAEEDAISET